MAGQKRNYYKIKYKDRLKIEKMLNAGKKTAEIADTIGVCRQTIYREIQRFNKYNEGKEYNAREAQELLFIK